MNKKITNIPLTNEQKETLINGIYNISFKENEEFINIEKYNKQKEEIERLQKENEILRHRLEVANEYIDSRKENMIIDHVIDLKYIINECDLDSTW